MKKLILISSTLLVSLSLVGCHTMNDGSQYANATVGTGVKYGAHAVGTGVGYVAGAGAAVGKGVGSVAGMGVGYVATTGATVGRGVGAVARTGTGYVTGHPVSYRYSNKYHTNKHYRKVVYHNGHPYVVENGRYVRVH